MPFISNGTTILDNGAFSVSLGSQVLISEQTASASASISFTSGIDSTYPIYKFEFINIHPATNNASFQVNFSTDGGSNYNVTKTTTNSRAYQNEAGTDTSLEYFSSEDLAQSTSDQIIGRTIGNDNDKCGSGILTLFNPSSTTFVKHFIINSNTLEGSDYFTNYYIAGYGNTTSAINAVRFQFSSGNIDDGTIKLYGIKDS